jgi:hypothetical protein
VVLHPNNWRALEVDFTHKRFYSSNDKRDSESLQSDGIELFIAKYCTSLVDCHLTVGKDCRGLNTLLNSLLQIKTLRRLSLKHDSEQRVVGGMRTVSRYADVMTIPEEGEKLLRGEPQCKGLELLSFKDIEVRAQDLEELLSVCWRLIDFVLPDPFTNQGLPNLEELYLYQAVQTLFVNTLAPAKKLKRLIFESDTGFHSMIAQDISQLLPNLQFLMYASPNAFFSGAHVETDITTYGNLTLAPSGVLRDRSLPKLQQLSRFISPRSHPKLLMEALLRSDSIDTIRYLVKTLKYDVNFS